MHEEWFHPPTAGRDYLAGPTLEPLEALRAHFTVFSNLDHDVRGGHSATHTFLSGVKATERSGSPEGNLTIDQRLAEAVGHETRFASLVLWDSGMNFTRTGVRVPAIASPGEAFRQLFVEESAGEKRFARAGLESSGSVLDAVRADARALAGRLGTGDREKLDEYFTALRETEAKLATAGRWLERAKPRIDDPAWTARADGTAAEEPYGAPQLEHWLELAYLAVLTDSTRALTIAVPSCNWGLAGVSEGYHPITHHGQREERLGQLRTIERFVTGALARFLERLRTGSGPDGASLLDSTLVLFGSGMGNGNRHTNSNLPLLLAGGGFRHGAHLDLEGAQPLCNLYLSMLRDLGCEAEGFQRSTGTLRGLESRGS